MKQKRFTCLHFFSMVCLCLAAISAQDGAEKPVAADYVNLFNISSTK